MTKYIVKTTCFTFKEVEAESKKQAEEFALYQPINDFEETAYVEVEEDFDE
tara:strand:- start:318 stop:470 length:153 start_codon:yes stop_codon:yes gene_type:complete